MTKSLLIVESAKKAKTIAGMLGAEYTVKATSGHILEMPADDMHVDLTDFTPTLYLMRGKGKTLEALKAAAASAEVVYLATDLDREGEAIAAHVADRLGAGARGKVRRITFTAITQADIRAALAAPRQIDRRLVEAQTARRVIDRLVGYMVSPVLWAGLSGRKRLSAGRVQSPALRLVVQRERDIAAFVPVEGWSVRAELSRQADAANPPQKFWAALHQIKGKPPELKTQADAGRVLTDLRGATWRVQRVEKGERLRRPYPPFTTDSLQQAASSQLGFNPRLTMKIAQELYEGVKLGEGKAVGLITYIRTDSVAVAPEAQQAAREVIAQYFGDAYLPPRPPVYQTRDKSAQEAHEAIRPVDPHHTPKGVEAHLTAQQHSLYRLIWRRFIASQMKPALYDTVTVDIETLVGGSPTVYLFRATGSTLKFAGFLKVYGVDVDAEESRRQQPATEADDDGSAENERMPEVQVGDALRLHQLLPKQHFTQPPSRFTEAQLIGQLKKLGLGRPSTYATIVETLKERLYVAVQQKRLLPTPLGVQVCELLEQRVALAVEVGFTAQMEENLDRIARGQAERVAVLREFYGPFKATVDAALTAARANRQPAAKVEAAPKRAPRAAPKSDKEGQPCPLCGEGVLQMKRSKYGPFLGCSRYSQGCTYTEKVATRRKSSSRGKGTGRRKKG